MVVIVMVLWQIVVMAVGCGVATYGGDCGVVTEDGDGDDTLWKK